MEFFNRKENVIDIKLTQYGKNLLSQGKFKPVFYSFHDNDIVYDSNYAGFGEPQSAAQDRIFETPRIKALNAFEGAETRIQKMTNIKNLGGSNPELFKYVDQSVLEDESLSFSDYQPTQTKYYGLGPMLGTSRLTSIYSPSWNISLVDGKILNSQDSIESYTTASINLERTPQINVELETKIKVIDPSLIENISAQELSSIQTTSEYGDGTSIDIATDAFLVDVQENNGERVKPAFNVEVFEIETDENNNEILRPLRFETVTNRDGDNYVMSVSTVTNSNEDKNYAEYYLDFSLDGQVQRQRNVPMPNRSSTPDFSIPVTPLSEVPVNDFLCPDELTSEEELDELYDDNSGQITVSGDDPFDDVSGGGTGGGGGGGGGASGGSY
jgi:hypothetical protein